jgi:hypothetical protein
MTKSQEHLADLAEHTLVFFKAAADAARAELEESREHSADAFAAVNTVSDGSTKRCEPDGCRRTS